MRLERALVGTLCIVAASAGGCGGRLAYNLPPASRLMEPGPGVGGPGPGVIPPAGNPYGIYGGAVGRFGDGMGGYVGGGYGSGGYGGGEPCAANVAGAPATNMAMAPERGPARNRVAAPDPGIVQAGFSGCDGACMAGDGCECGTECGCGDGYGCGDGCCIGGGGCCPICGCVAGSCLCRAGGAVGGALQGLFSGGGDFSGRPGSMEAFAGGGPATGMPTSQIAFLGAEGVQVAWDVSGYGRFDSTPLVIPARQDFYQGAIYRLKLTNIPGRPGVELYPTLEVAPVTPRTDAYLAHSPIPVQFTEEDFDQALSGNFVTKVIYLPDPEFQELALAGVETLVSTRLDPGVDPIAEADRRGSILAIVRLGNKDLEPGYGESYTPEQVVPAGYVAPASDTAGQRFSANRAVFNQDVSAAQAAPANGGAIQAQYGAPCGPGDGYDGRFSGGAMANMPAGMPTAGFAPPAMPPNYVAGAPQWGMPITGTPIGLPGPPHIPLGAPAGLQQHVMRNRTRVLMPPPVAKTKITVKQRPGLNYPRPVNQVQINETQREPLRLIPSWVSGLFHHTGHAGANCDPNCQ